MKRLLSLLLVLAMLFSVCTMFTACDDSYSASDRDDDDKKSDKVQTRVFQGLTIGLGKAYKEEEKNDNMATYSNGQYVVVVQFGENTEEFSARELYKEYEESLEFMEEEGEITNVDTGKSKDTYYIAFTNADETSAMAAAFYVTDAYCWIVQIRKVMEDTEDFSLESMIKLITGWECEDPDDYEGGNSGVVEDFPAEGEDVERPVDATQAGTESTMATAATIAPPEPSMPSATIDDLIIELPDSFVYQYGDEEHITYENEYYLFQVQFLSGNFYYDSAYELMDQYVQMLGLDGTNDEHYMEYAFCEAYGIPYMYTTDYYGYTMAYGFYVQDGCGWVVMNGNYHSEEYNIYEMCDLVICHYFR